MILGYKHNQPIFLFFTRRWNEVGLQLLFVFAFSLTIILIAFINIGSLVSFALFFLVSISSYRLLFGKNIKKAAGLFVFYSLMAIALYLVQYATYPEYQGFSGGLGIGTDDAAFFVSAVGQGPVNVPFRLATLPFTNILKIVVKVLPLKDIHLLDVLFFNIFGLTFIPIFTSFVAYILTEEKKISDLVFKFSMICPVIMANGLILVRDGWTAVLFIGAIYFLLSDRYILLATTSALLFYIRIASGVQLMIALLFFAYYKFTYKADYTIKFLFAMSAVVVFLTVSAALFPTIMEYAEEKGITENIFFREAFAEGFIARSVEMLGDESIFYEITTKPFYLRLPLSFIFFLCAPFISIGNLSHYGIYIPRAFLEQFFAILFLFYFKYLIQGIMYIWKKNELAVRTVAITFFLLMLFISQLSLQFRHKTLIMPLFYILVAYGFYYKTNLGKIFGIGGVISLALVQGAVNIMRII